VRACSVIVRISTGRFDTRKADEIESALLATHDTLRTPLERLSGLITFYGGIDKQAGYMTNTSLWETLDAAQQMGSLPEMAAARMQFEALGVTFDEITNHEVVWEVSAS
jgi:hypothetical protein